MNKYYKIGAIVLAGCIVLALFTLPSRSAGIGSEEALAGGSVLADKVVNGVSQAAVSISPQSVEQNNQGATIEQGTQKKPEHVSLNLNYSRLGIASKVDTYLNVRKKPSEKSKVVGKLTKNAGCHVYSIKNGWAKIVSGKVRGYVKKSFMVFDKQAEELAKKVGKTVAVIDTPALKVRQLPSKKSHIFAVVALEEELPIKSGNVTTDFLKKVIKKNDISSKRVSNCGGVENLSKTLDDWICVEVDDEYAFIAKEYVKKQYSLKRAVKIGDMKASAKDGVSSTQANIVEFAKKFLGNRYVWGGTSLTNGTDCSGFTQSIYAHFGHGLPRTAASQCAAVSKASGSPKPGDLFFYSNGSRVNHVALYIGSGMVIHASNPSDGIKISTAYYRSPVKVGRIL